MTAKNRTPATVNGQVKRLVIFLFCMALLTGCNDRPNPDTSFNIIELNGHTYIAYYGGSYDRGLVHDPDCNCGHMAR